MCLYLPCISLYLASRCARRGGGGGEEAGRGPCAEACCGGPLLECPARAARGGGGGRSTGGHVQVAAGAALVQHVLPALYLPRSPQISPDLPISRHFRPYLPTSPQISPHLPTSPHISTHLPISPRCSSPRAAGWLLGGCDPTRSGQVALVPFIDEMERKLNYSYTCSAEVAS